MAEVVSCRSLTRKHEIEKILKFVSLIAAKETFSIMNGLLGKMSKNTKISDIKFNDIDYTDSEEVMELLNDHFTNVGSTLAKNIPDNTSNPEEFIPNTRAAFLAISTNSQVFCVRCNK